MRLSLSLPPKDISVLRPSWRNTGNILSNDAQGGKLDKPMSNLFPGERVPPHDE